MQHIHEKLKIKFSKKIPFALKFTHGKKIIVRTFLSLYIIPSHLMFIHFSSLQIISASFYVVMY